VAKPNIVQLLDSLAQCSDVEAVKRLRDIRVQLVDLLVTGEALVREADAAAKREGGNRDPSHNTAVRAAIRAQAIARYGDEA
jgi:DNA-binding MarR family transcriptional regulator